MNLKNIILAGLLLPVCCLGNTLENLTLEQLQEKQYQTLFEIRELRKIITEGGEYLRYSRAIYWDLITISAEKRKKELEDPTEEQGAENIEIEKLEQAIYNENQLIFNELEDMLRENKKFNRSLFYELFNGKDIKSATSFNLDKFLAASLPFEIAFIMLTVTKYEKCIQKLIEINEAIFDLEKN